MPWRPRARILLLGLRPVRPYGNRSAGRLLGVQEERVYERVRRDLPISPTESTPDKIAFCKNKQSHPSTRRFRYTPCVSLPIGFWCPRDPRIGAMVPGWRRWYCMGAHILVYA